MNEFALAEQLDQALDAVLRGAPPFAGPEIGALLAAVEPLRDLPSEEYKSHLWSQLERKISMVTKVPPGLRNLVPYLQVPDVGKVLAFYQEALGAEVVYRREQPGHEHAQVRIGDTTIMMGGGGIVEPRPTSLHFYVDGVDEMYRRAVAAGARPIGFGGASGEPADHHYGERSGFFTDPGGNHWYVAERATSKILHKDMGSVTPYLHPDGAARMIEFLQQAFAADVVERYGEPGRVAHCKMRIGESILELGDAGPEGPNQPSSFYLYVGDLDSVYRQVLAAGATSLSAPAIQEWGDYNAMVLDPFGNRWFVGEFQPSRKSS